MFLEAGNKFDVGGSGRWIVSLLIFPLVMVLLFLCLFSTPLMIFMSSFLITLSFLKFLTLLSISPASIDEGPLFF